ncbi:sulfatase [Pontiella sulfatireligans]|uniref:Choline-sulfatase n=1 Tax=Pontiella sulfatireligans TaxID=2750658 RepID=A0A6C2UWE0_9BACT|nr:sulfatase [Pontiella sulfatireligans]SPS74550.1 sulfatase S1_7 [Kiritimatiellales bacterium]VGO23156.1 Choline-sulfatase [Pontiella sulfatireligans]
MIPRFGKLARTGLLVALSGFTFQGSSFAAKPPNVLFVAVDDLRTDLGCYVADYMKTPNIDKLANGGLLFEQAYCQQAVCGPSRISLLTGLRPDTTKVYTLDQPLDKELPDTLTLPQHFKQNGYKTISLGKIYHHGTDDKEFWDVLDSCSAPKYANPKNVALVEKLTKEAHAKGLTKGKEFRKATQGPPVECADVPDNTYGDGITADRAIEAIRNKGDEPLFLAVGFRKPHLTFAAPKTYWDLYDHDTITIPSHDRPEGAADLAFTTWGELRGYHGMPENGGVTDEQAKTLIHGYRACVSYIDAQLGRVLAELDKQGLREDTIIVLWGDHGWKLGDYGDWCKHTNFELDTHVPLIYSGLGVPAGKRSAALVEFVDIFPTLAEACGLEVPECDGLSSVPLFKDPSKPWKKAAFSQYPRGGGMGHTIRSGKWRYTEWKNSKGKVTARELYDHSESDIATVNLADHPEYKNVAKKMAAILKAGPESALPKN